MQHERSSLVTITFNHVEAQTFPIWKSLRLLLLDPLKNEIFDAIAGVWDFIWKQKTWIRMRLIEIKFTHLPR